MTEELITLFSPLFYLLYLTEIQYDLSLINEQDSTTIFKTVLTHYVHPV